jgi:hypothetical protein
MIIQPACCSSSHLSIRIFEVLPRETRKTYFVVQQLSSWTAIAIAQETSAVEFGDRIIQILSYGLVPDALVVPDASSCCCFLVPFLLSSQGMICTLLKRTASGIFVACFTPFTQPLPFNFPTLSQVPG